MSITSGSRRKVLFLIPLLTLGLSGCWYSALPSQQNIDVNGTYLGRLASIDGSSALLDITLVETNLALSATVKNRANTQTYALTGTRSVYTNSPVNLSLTGSFGAGSACPGGYTDTYGVNATLQYGYGAASGKVQGNGFVTHKTCVGGVLTQSTTDSGSLELSKQ